MPNLSDALASKVTGYTVDLLEYETQLIQEVQGFIVELEREVIDKLKEIDPSSTLHPKLRKEKLNVLLSEVQKSSSVKYEGIYKHLQERLRQLTEFDSDTIRNLVNKAVGTDLMTKGLNKESVRSLVSGTLVDGAPQKEWWSRQGDNFSKKFSDNVRQGLFQNEDANQISRRITGESTGGRMHYRTPTGEKRSRARYRGGIIQTSRSHATSLVITSTQSVIQKGRLDLYKLNSDVVKGYQALVALDGKTSDICISRSGKVWNLDGDGIDGSGPFPGPPPWHWRCRTTLIPLMKSFTEVTTGTGTSQLKRMEVADKKSVLQNSMDGVVASDLSYGTWLKTRPVEFQKAVLGVTRWTLWQKGNLELRQLVTPSGKTRTLEELNKKYNKETEKFERLLPWLDDPKIKGGPIGYKIEEVYKALGVTAPPKELTEEIKGMIGDYTLDSYGTINNFLRGKEGFLRESSDAKFQSVQILQRLQEFLLAQRTKKKMLVVRDFAYTSSAKSKVVEVLGDLKVGDKFTDWGFASTSLRKKLSTKSTFNETAIEIEVPEGTNGYYLGNLGEYPSEFEFLLPYGSEFEVIKAATKSSPMRVRVVGLNTTKSYKEIAAHNLGQVKVRERFEELLETKNVEEITGYRLPLDPPEDLVLFKRDLDFLVKDGDISVVEKTLAKDIFDGEDVIKVLGKNPRPEEVEWLRGVVSAGVRVEFGKILRKIGKTAEERKKILAVKAAKEKEAKEIAAKEAAEKEAKLKEQKIREEAAKKITEQKSNFIPIPPTTIAKDFGLPARIKSAEDYLKQRKLGSNEQFEKFEVPEDIRELTELVLNYTGGGYNGLNTYLRGGFAQKGWQKEKIEKFLDFLKSQKVNKSIVVTRDLEYGGISGVAQKLIGDLKVGDKFTDWGVASTTIEKMEFKKYGLPKTAVNKFVEIEVPEGSSGWFVGKTSLNPQELEFLIAAGTEYEVIALATATTPMRVRVVRINDTDNFQVSSARNFLESEIETITDHLEGKKDSVKFFDGWQARVRDKVRDAVAESNTIDEVMDKLEDVGKTYVNFYDLSKKLINGVTAEQIETAAKQGVKKAVEKYARTRIGKKYEAPEKQKREKLPEEKQLAQGLVYLQKKAEEAKAKRLAEEKKIAETKYIEEDTQKVKDHLNGTQSKIAPDSAVALRSFSSSGNKDINDFLRGKIDEVCKIG